ncbi:hypothetical protein [Streptomyces sp. NPDC088789]|uniref:hypothetical protein n=1 Tax=Streptomyces sp. NPDC088789 TaxID=3365899 RepID=UPI0038114782
MKLHLHRSRTTEDDTLFLLLRSLHQFFTACHDDPELLARHPALTERAEESAECGPPRRHREPSGRRTHPDPIQLRKLRRLRHRGAGD